MEALAKAVLSNQQIETINFTSSLMNSAHFDAMSPLAELVLPSHPSLRILHLAYNRLTNTASIGAALQTNSVLKELHLDHNLINNVSAVALAQGLRQNESLEGGGKRGLLVIYLVAGIVGILQKGRRQHGQGDSLLLTMSLPPSSDR